MASRCLLRTLDLTCCRSQGAEAPPADAMLLRRLKTEGIDVITGISQRFFMSGKSRPILPEAHAPQTGHTAAASPNVAINSRRLMIAPSPGDGIVTGGTNALEGVQTALGVAGRDAPNVRFGSIEALKVDCRQLVPGCRAIISSR